MDVLMPQLGETVAEGTISKWFVKAGDAVKPGDNLFEIETDKVSMEVPAIAAGMLAAIHVQAGEVAPVGAVVAVILRVMGKRLRQPLQLRSFPRKRESRKAKNWVPAFAGTSGLLKYRAHQSLPSRWSPSAKCAHPTATMARRACPAAQW